MPMAYDVRVRFACAPEVVERQFGRWATVEPDGDGCVLQMSTDWLDWPLMTITAIDADFTVESPPELVERVRAAAVRLSSAG